MTGSDMVDRSDSPIGIPRLVGDRLCPVSMVRAAARAAVPPVLLRCWNAVIAHGICGQISFRGYRSALKVFWVAFQVCNSTASGHSLPLAQFGGEKIGKKCGG